MEKWSKFEVLTVVFKTIKKIADTLSKHLSDVESKSANLEDSLLETETFTNCLRREIHCADNLFHKF